MACMLLSAQTQTDVHKHTHTDLQPSTHRNAVTRVLPLFFSIYHSVAESAAVVSLLQYVPWLFVARAPVRPHTPTHLLGRVCVCVFVGAHVVQSPRRDGRGRQWTSVGFWMGRRCNRSCCTGQDWEKQKQTLKESNLIEKRVRRLSGMKTHTHNCMKSNFFYLHLTYRILICRGRLSWATVASP